MKKILFIAAGLILNINISAQRYETSITGGVNYGYVILNNIIQYQELEPILLNDDYINNPTFSTMIEEKKYSAFKNNIGYNLNLIISDSTSVKNVALYYGIGISMNDIDYNIDYSVKGNVYYIINDSMHVKYNVDEVRAIYNSKGELLKSDYNYDFKSRNFFIKNYFGLKIKATKNDKLCFLLGCVYNVNIFELYYYKNNDKFISSFTGSDLQFVSGLNISIGISYNVFKNFGLEFKLEPSVYNDISPDTSYFYNRDIYYGLNFMSLNLTYSFQKSVSKINQK